MQPTHAKDVSVAQGFSPAVPGGRVELLAWWREADLRARRAFIAASMGWMLDSFDVMLYSIVLASLLQDPTLNLTKATAGILNSVTLLAAAAGGIAFGIIADRIGRKRALMAAVSKETELRMPAVAFVRLRVGS